MRLMIMQRINAQSIRIQHEDQIKNHLQNSIMKHFYAQMGLAKGSTRVKEGYLV